MAFDKGDEQVQSQGDVIGLIFGKCPIDFVNEFIVWCGVIGHFIFSD